jgi:hypothetical protein
LVFLCPREREREGERGGEIEGGEGRERERGDKREERGEREKREERGETREEAIIFINRLGQNGKSAKY